MELVNNVHHLEDAFLHQVASLDLPDHFPQAQGRVVSPLVDAHDLHSEVQFVGGHFLLHVSLLLLRTDDQEGKVELGDLEDVLDGEEAPYFEVEVLEGILVVEELFGPGAEENLGCGEWW